MRGLINSSLSLVMSRAPSAFARLRDATRTSSKMGSEDRTPRKKTRESFKDGAACMSMAFDAVMP